MSAGLGGGSSDAATALMLANHVWAVGWSFARLAKLAAELGSDVPFFFSNGAAVCRGRGEQVERVDAFGPLHFVVDKPPANLSTADVYRAYDSLPRTSLGSTSARASRIAEALAGGRRREPGLRLHNGLQSAAAALSPWVDRLRSVFDRLNFVGHQLSGSGSAYFGVCRHAQHARRLACILKTRQVGLVYATRSCGLGRA
jgi:4-diphosphocytidyl-2-C-methyl-D-erythritol kinase